MIKSSLIALLINLAVLLPGGEGPSHVFNLTSVEQGPVTIQGWSSGETASHGQLDFYIKIKGEKIDGNKIMVAYIFTLDSKDVILVSTHEQSVVEGLSANEDIFDAYFPNKKKVSERKYMALPLEKLEGCRLYVSVTYRSDGDLRRVMLSGMRYNSDFLTGH